MVLLWACAIVALLLLAALIVLLCCRASPYNIDRELRALGKEASSEPQPCTQDKAVCIIGAGVSGLFAAYKLRKHCNITVVEASSAPGGNNRSSPIGSSEVPVQYGCSGWSTSPTLTSLLKELSLHKQEVKQHVAALVEGRLEYKRFDAAFPSSNPHSRFHCFAWARSYPMWQQFRWCLCWAYAHMLYYFFPLQNWSATDVLIRNNTGVDDVLIPQAGINVFTDRCDLPRCPYTYFVRYASLYCGRKFFCIREGNHELIRRLYEETSSHCDFHFDCPVAEISGTEGCFHVHMKSGDVLGPFHELIMTCQPHQAAAMLPSDSCYVKHRECTSLFEAVVARSAVHNDMSAWEKADDQKLELGVLYDRSLPAEDKREHHYLHINTSEFYGIKDVPRDTFVTVAYDDADPKDVVMKDTILKEYRTTLSRVKVDCQKTLPKMIREIHQKSHGIHLAGASYLGLMWHEDGLMMAQLASKACLRSLQQAHSSLHSKNESTSSKHAVLDAFADSESTDSPNTSSAGTDEQLSSGADITTGISVDEDEPLSNLSPLSHESLSNSNHVPEFADVV